MRLKKQSNNLNSIWTRLVVTKVTNCNRHGIEGGKGGARGAGGWMEWVGYQ